jgi:hypothetical protein
MDRYLRGGFRQTCVDQQQAQPAFLRRRSAAVDKRQHFGEASQASHPPVLLREHRDILERERRGAHQRIESGERLTTRRVPTEIECGARDLCHR